MSFILDVQFEESLEGNLSEFELEVINSKHLLESSRAGTQPSSGLNQDMSALQKKKIKKLKERLEDVEKSQHFLKHKLDHYVKCYEGRIADKEEQNKILARQIATLRQEFKQYGSDLNTIQSYVSKKIAHSPQKKLSPASKTRIISLKDTSPPLLKHKQSNRSVQAQPKQNTSTQVMQVQRKQVRPATHKSVKSVDKKGKSFSGPKYWV